MIPTLQLPSGVERLNIQMDNDGTTYKNRTLTCKGDQNMSLNINMFWHIDNFELKAIEKQQM